MSLLPMLIFLISLGVAVMGSFEKAYRGALFLISGVVVHLDQNTLDALAHVRGALAALPVPALLLLAWTSRRIFASLFSALERIFGVPGRSFARGNLMALGMVLVAGVGLLITMVFTMTIATAEGLVTRFIGPEQAGALHALLGARRDAGRPHRHHVQLLLPHLPPGAAKGRLDRARGERRAAGDRALGAGEERVRVLPAGILPEWRVSTGRSRA